MKIPFSLETTSSSSEEQNRPKIGSILRSSPDLFHQLIHYEKELSEIIEKNFGGQLTLITDLSQKNSNYSSHIQLIDKYTADATDLNETFRQVIFCDIILLIKFSFSSPLGYDVDYVCSTSDDISHCTTKTTSRTS
jgi:hypothetical protein